MIENKQNIKIEKCFYITNDSKEIESVLNKFQNCLPSLRSGIEYRRMIAQKLAKYAFFLVYRVDGEYIAFSAFYANNYNTKTAYISFIAVAENHRDKQIGSLILNKVVDIALNNGMEYIKLEVNKNNTAHSFYLKNGFKDLDEASCESIYMIKRIGE